MKEMEDFLKRKLFGQQEPGSKSQNDQLWDKIDKGLSMDGAPKAPLTTVHHPRRPLLRWLAVLGSLCLVTTCVRSLTKRKAPSSATEIVSQSVVQDSSFTDLERSTTKEDAVKTQELEHIALEKTASGKDLTDVSANTKHSAGERNETGTEQQFLDQERSNHSHRLTKTADKSSPKPDFNNRGGDSVDIQKLHPKYPKPWSINRPLMAQHVHRLDCSKYLAMRTFGGVTVSQTSINEALGSAYRSGFGAGGGVAIDWGGANGRHWSLGIGFYEFVQVMEHQMSVTTEFINNEGVQTVLINPISGDTTNVLGPVTSVEHHQRHVLSYNRLRQVAMPVEWRKEETIGRWTAGISLGATALFRVQGEGYMATADSQIFTYSNFDLPRLKLNVSPTIGLYGGFQFQPEWRIDLSWTAGVQGFNSTSSEDMTSIEARPWTGRIATQSVQLGLTRFFSHSEAKH